MRYVYFAQIGDDRRFVKIGCSCHVQIRLQALSTALKAKARLIALIPGSFARERYLHGKFAHLRVGAADPIMDRLRLAAQNEWFWLGADLLAFIEEIQVGKNPLSVTELAETAEDPRFEASSDRLRNDCSRRHSDRRARFISWRFGGRLVLAEAIGLPKSEVDAWHRDNWSVPAEYHQPILAAARRLGVDVTPFDFADC